MALVHDDQVEEVGRILSVKPRTAFILGNRLVDGKIHLPPVADLASWLSWMRALSKGCEILVLRIVDEDVAIRQIKDFGPTWFSPAVPQGVPQLPANLKGNHSLAGAGRHRDQNPSLPSEDRLDHPIDGDLLVVAKVFFGLVVAGSKELFGKLVVA